MDQFLERDSLPKLTQEVGNLNKPVSIKNIQLIINNLPKQKALGSDGFTGEFDQTFKKEIISILCNLFQRIKAEGTLPILFNEASITLIPKADKGIVRKENYQPICLFNT